MLLGVNIDHIAVLKEARKVADPDPLMAVGICKEAGADQITIHLREDRRHMLDYDAERIIENSQLPVNFECGLDEEIIEIACRLKPYRVTLVPEKREEVTTEGGLDLFGQGEKLEKAIKKFHDNEIEVSLFIDPDENIVSESKRLGVEAVEFHTGKYANLYAMLYSNLSNTPHSIKEFELPRKELKKLLKIELDLLKEVCKQAKELDLFVAAGHGLNYQNVKDIVGIKEIEELNIGQSIVARSVFSGLHNAIEDMSKLVK
ncbi:MAG: pyridoxine 5'-phosphate synthase [Campylobacterales bacterium]|nr:pyridoxine 5'-phosphate synthase [Campylobacterales bacterium]